jgi:hypothetical protein
MNPAGPGRRCTPSSRATRARGREVKVVAVMQGASSHSTDAPGTRFTARHCICMHDWLATN